MATNHYTTNEAAIELGVTSARVRQMILNGELEAEKFGRDLMITAEALDAARARKTAPGPEPKKRGPSRVKRTSRKR